MSNLLSTIYLYPYSQNIRTKILKTTKKDWIISSPFYKHFLSPIENFKRQMVINRYPNSAIQIC